MDLKDMRSIWQNAGRADKTEGDLRKMMQVPAVKKIKIRLILETVGLLFLLTIYYDWFDGSQKPFYANAMLVVAALSLITKDVIGYTYLLKPAIEADIKTSLYRLLSRTVRLSRFSVVLSCVYSVALIVYFTSVVHFTREKYFILIGGIVLMTQVMLWSQRVWDKSVKNLRKQLEDLIRE